MLGRVTTGVMYGSPNIYTVVVLTNNVEHDFKYVQHLAQKLKCKEIKKIKCRHKSVDIIVYFINKYAAEKYARLVEKCHLYDNDFKTW